MNTDLYQSLAVGLLAAITILLVLAIAYLGRIRRAVEANGTSLREALSGGGAEREAVVGSTATEETEEPAPSGAAPTAEPEEAAPAQVAQVQTAGPHEAHTAADTGWEEGGRAAEEERALTASEGEPARDAEVEPAAVSAGRTEGAYETTRTARDIEEEPQEQPFERDGRWWFRRGEELLVYDEQTGQWLPAPGPTAGSSSAPQPEAGGAGAAVATETRTSTMAEQRSEATPSPSQEASGGFWKCPACGAVNGSTATSCRMCFSARP
jgi:hypothetical protein